MTRFSRILSLSALPALALASAAFAQEARDPNQQFDKVLPQKVLETDAVPVTANPVVQPLPAPAPTYPVVQQWGLNDATRLLAAIRAIGAEGLDPLDYHP